MPLLSFSGTPVKGSSTTVTLDKSTLLGIPSVSGDPFWSGDDGDIATVMVTYKSTVGNGKRLLEFDFSAASPSAVLNLPLYCRDAFSIHKVVLIDTMGDKLVLSTSDLTSLPAGDTTLNLGNYLLDEGAFTATFTGAAFDEGSFTSSFSGTALDEGPF